MADQQNNVGPLRLAGQWCRRCVPRLSRRPASLPSLLQQFFNSSSTILQLALRAKSIDTSHALTAPRLLFFIWSSSLPLYVQSHLRPLIAPSIKQRSLASVKHPHLLVFTTPTDASFSCPSTPVDGNPSSQIRLPARNTIATRISV